MTTQYYAASRLDGFVATVDDSLEWLFPLGRIEDTSYPEFFSGVGALAMGSATYEWMLRHVVGGTAKVTTTLRAESKQTLRGSVLTWREVDGLAPMAQTS